MKKLLFLTAFVWYSLSMIYGQQVPQLVQDIREVPKSSFPRFTTQIGQHFYFSANSDTYGIELWKSDGTQAGTQLVHDIASGQDTSNPWNLTKFGDKLLFNANGTELWITDGTSRGTRKIGNVSLRDGEGAEANGVYVFSGPVTGQGSQVWRTDGTTRGTYLLLEVNDWHNATPNSFVGIGNKLLFSAYSDNDGRHWWVSNGTKSGTSRMDTLKTGAHKNKSIAFKGKAYFSAAGPAGRSGLWQSDGTEAGTKLISDVWAPSEFCVKGDYLYFSGNDRTHGHELWRTDGTRLGTKMVKDLNPGSESSNPSELTSTGKGVFFIAEVDKGKELYFSDGTEENTGITRDIIAGPEESKVNELTAIGDTLFFTALMNDTADFSTLYMSTGNAASTKIVLQELPELYAGWSNELVALGNKLFFSARDDKRGDELWISDGTEKGTKLLIDINPGTVGSYIREIVNYKKGIAFNAVHSEFGRELWTTNGVANTTRIIKDVVPGIYGTYPDQLLASGEHIYYFAWPHFSDEELHYTNGTEKQFFFHSPTSDEDELSYLTAIGKDSILFARKSDFTNELWLFANGTSKRVRQISVRDGGASVKYLTRAGKYTYFLADDGSGQTGLELWVTDGNESGTRLLKDIRPGPLGSFPWNFTPSGNRFYFTAIPTSNNRKLLVSDGSRVGTKEILNGNDLGNSSTVEMIGDGLGNVYCYFGDQDHGFELWFSDGTNEGTRILKDINVGKGNSDIRFLGANEANVWFTANDGVHGLELWHSDGTESGTRMVKEIRPGIESSDLKNLLIVRDKVYFSADDGFSGSELWESDGTEAGTKMVYDLRTGPIGSSPRELTLRNDSLYFLANNQAYGEELFYIFTNCMAPRFSYQKSCLGDEIIFTNLSDPLNQDGQISYYWQVGNKGSKVNQKDFVTSFEKGDPRKVILTMSGGDCEAKSHQLIEFFPEVEPNALIGKEFTQTRIDTYSVTDREGAVYIWSITNGTQIDGGNTAQVIIEWDENAENGRVEVVEINSFGCQSETKSLAVLFDFEKSINQHTIYKLQIYPNPTDDRVYIHPPFPKEPFKLTIHDISGNMVFEKLYSISQSNGISIDLKHLTIGVYDITLHYKNGIAKGPLLIQH